MKNRFSQMLLLSGAIILIPACNTKEDCKAGSGGSVTLKLYPEHHTKPIIGSAVYPDSAFIKFNTQNFPGDNPAAYDLVIKGDSASNMVTIKDLKCGDYYIYMAGWDSSIATRVRGGIPYSIADGETGERNIKVPVTED